MNSGLGEPPGPGWLDRQKLGGGVPGAGWYGFLCPLLAGVWG